ncbi:MAG: ABC-F family ATP-binding cassette domain-containing protein [Nitrospiria bacterium]
MSSTPLISCQSLGKSYGTQCLFSDISLGFFVNERLGLIGPNGSGKTTLLKILAGIEGPSDGKVSRRRQARIYYLPQKDRLDAECTVLEVLFQAIPERIEDWASDKDIRSIIDGAGFPDLDQGVGTLSGGWQKRAAIAQALLLKPDLLLMDEPTNHLDLEGILWLEAVLNKADFAFVLISHDRFFLENTTNRIVELNGAYPNGFIKVEGNYSRYLEQRDAAIHAQARQEEALSSKVRRELAWLARGPKARTTKAKHRVAQAALLQEDLVAVKARMAQNQQAQLAFDPTDRKTKKLLEVKNLSKFLGEKTLFRDVHFILSPGFCLGLLGRNGSGKSTLIHLLNGQLKPDSGLIRRTEGLQIVTFGQKREQLDQDQSLKSALCPSGDQVVYRGKPIHVVAWAKRFLFTEPQLALPVSRLSGGEQARVLIANLMLQPADILLLDEPTNDLDIPTLEVLEDSLEAFTGAIVLITHDRFLLDRLSDTIFSLEGNGRTAFYADIYQWQQARQHRAALDRPSEKASRKQTEAVEKPPQKLSHEERKELKRIEAKIEKASEAVEAVKTQLHDPAIRSDAERLMALTEELQAAEEKVEGLYRRWEELETRKG